MRGRLACGVALAAALLLVGCRLHVQQVLVNQALSEERYQRIVLGESTRRDVLQLLGPPDGAHYTPSELIFDYWTASHVGNDLELFVPSNLIPGLDPLAVFGVAEFFLDPFVEPEEFRPTFLEFSGRNLTDGAIRSAPFLGGQEVVQLHGRKVRVGRLRVVFDLETLAATHKALRLASGEYQDESFAEELLLMDD